MILLQCGHIPSMREEMRLASGARLAFCTFCASWQPLFDQTGNDEQLSTGGE